MKEQLFELCKDALNNAYAPYSNYHVSAALLLNNGETFIGVNVENAAYGDTICAERVCITSAYAHGYRKNDIKAFALMTQSKDLGMPCGSCRQVLSELLNQDTIIYVFNSEGKCLETNMKELLPYSFESEDLYNV